jgi:DNA-binding NtrC family response regulator
MASQNASQASTTRATATPLKPNILVVDDDVMIGEQLERLFSHSGYAVTIANRAEQALEFLEQEDIDLVVTDIRLPGIDGVELTKRIAARWSDVPVIVVTGYGDIETAVEVLKLGASDFIVKPFSAAAIHESTQAGLEKASLFMEIRHLRHRLKESCEFGGMLSRTPEMHRVFEIIRTVAPTDSTVVIEGETGTGKELVASAIHYQSERRDHPFVTINCGGFPEQLLESELFGYERGAFTGANQSRPGKIEMAHGGTLFLDEIENMPLSMQVKLLLVLNNQRVQRLGSNHWTQVDMRIIAASNIPLKDLVAQGKIRSDFYYRVNVISIELLPLRQRLDDLPILIRDFLRHHPVALRKNITGIAKSAIDHLMQYSWPGNVRELHNVLEKAVILGKSRVINASDLDVDLEHPKRESATGSTAPKNPSELPLYLWIREKEKEYLIQKLSAFRGRIGLTAKSCGMEVRTLHRKMQLYGLDKKTFSKRI